MKIDKDKTFKINGSKLKIVIVLPYFNENLGLELLKNTRETLEKNKVKKIETVRVFGSLEIPFICQKIAKKLKPDVIIALGVVLRGNTKHFDLVTEVTYHGLMRVQLSESIPIIFGILTCDNIKQAKDRISAKKLNKGKEFAYSALIQSTLLR